MSFQVGPRVFSHREPRVHSQRGLEPLRTGRPDSIPSIWTQNQFPQAQSQFAQESIPTGCPESIPSEGPEPRVNSQSGDCSDKEKERSDASSMINRSFGLRDEAYLLRLCVYCCSSCTVLIYRCTLLWYSTALHKKRDCSTELFEKNQIES